jgi:hypothetical protein
MGAPDLPAAATTSIPSPTDASFFARVCGELMRDRPRWLSQGAAGFFGMPEVNADIEAFVGSLAIGNLGVAFGAGLA